MMNNKKALIELLVVIAFHNISLLLMGRVFVEFGGAISTLMTVGFIGWRLSRHQESLKSIGIFKPANLALALVAPVVTMVAAMFFSTLTVVVLRSFGIASQVPDIARFTGMAGNVPLYIQWLFMALLASPGEEIIYRGFMISRLEKVLGRSWFAMAGVLLLEAGYFGARHYYQGVVQAYAAGVIGLVFGLSYFLTKRNLWAAMIAHACLNIMSLTGRFLG